MLVAVLVFISLFALFAVRPLFAAESSLAVINAGISSSEDAPFVPHEYRFLPGDFVYLTFEISGFAVQSESRGEVRKISLRYEIVPQDQEGRALAVPVSDAIQAELSPEDKNWVPKRRASFLVPSFVAAGSFHLHVSVKDLVAKTEASRDVPFQIGGVEIKTAASLTVQNFHFFRNENAKEVLTVPAFSPGDTVYARFEITGYRFGAANQYHVSYGLTVSAPDGSTYLKNEQAADLTADSFYPAQYVPGNLEITTAKTSLGGEYIITLKVHDLIAQQYVEVKQAFSLE